MATVLKWPTGRTFIVQDQESSWYCWASVGEALACYYLGDRWADQKQTQRDLAAEYARVVLKPELELAQRTGDQGKVEKLTKTMTNGGARTAVEAVKLVGYFREASPKAKLTPTDALYNTIKTEIDNGFPIVFSGRYTQLSRAGHMVLVYGYDDSNKHVYVADPHNGSTRTDHMTFVSFCNSYRGWPFEYEQYVLTQPNEWATLRPLFDGV